jgi:hypothetical protein
MVKESSLGLALTALGVGLTGALLVVELAQNVNPGGTPIFQAQPSQPIQRAPVRPAPEPTWTELHREAPAMFGGGTGTAGFGGGNFDPSPPNPRVTGPNIFGGGQGTNTGISASQTQYSGTTNPLITGTRYGKLLGLSAGKRFVYHAPLHGKFASGNPDPVPVF